MGNLARDYQLPQKEIQKSQDTSLEKVKKSWFTSGEKIMGVAFASIVCFGAVHLIGTQSKIYQVNKDIQIMETKISDQQKVNSDLQVQVSELSNYERIYQKAKKMGLELNENNVKVVQGK